MKKSILSLAVILVVLLLSSGCGGKNDNGGGTSTGTNYHKGTAAIKLAFLQNSPPDVMYDGQTFPFSLEITNLGATDTTAFISLTGHDRNIISINWDNSRVGPISAKSENFPSGGYGSLEGTAQIRLPKESDTYPTTLKVTACYPYTTEATIPLCIDPDPTNNRDDVCTPKAVTISDGQGSPIAVKSVVPHPTIGMSSFTITIQNMGTGNVLRADKVEVCLTRLPPPDLDVVEVVDAKIGVNSLECNPALIRLVNKVGTTTCKGAVSPVGAYTANLMLNLRYGYKDSITKQVTVRRV